MLIYNHVPDFSSLEGSMSHINYVILIDNGSRPEITNELSSFQERNATRCILIRNKENLGISKAYNEAVRQLSSLGVHWFYLFDHDALFGEEYFLETQKAWIAMEARGITVGMVVPIVSDDKLLLGSRLGIRSKYSLVDTAITSGVFTNLVAYNHINGFDESFFVYGADIDFSLRIAESGRKICRVNIVLVSQDIGPQSSSDGCLDSRLAKISSSVFLALHFINFYQTRLTRYSKGLQEVLDFSTRRINRRHHRYLHELLRIGMRFPKSLLSILS